MPESTIPRDPSAAEALANLDRLPRTPFAMVPTPLVRLVALERALQDELGHAVPEILIKLDAYTGFGLGGNKVRKLEYVLAGERLGDVTHLVTAGGVQSNHARVTAAAAARLGLRCVLVLNGEAPAIPRGNARLQRLFGAEVITVSSREERTSTMIQVTEDIAAAGGEALAIPVGASTPLGALGYVRAFVEFENQLRSRSVEGGAASTSAPTVVFVASSSAGTLAGLHLGASLIGRTDIDLIGVSADTPRAELLETTSRLAMGAGLRIGWSGTLDTGRLDVADGYVGTGYGIPTRDSERAAELFGRAAGVVLDQTYTAKAAAGMIDWLRTGRVTSDNRVVFWHTGGWPAAV